VRIAIGLTATQIDSADFCLASILRRPTSHLLELTREVSAILSEYAYGDGQLPQEPATSSYRVAAHRAHGRIELYMRAW